MVQSFSAIKPCHPESGETYARVQLLVNGVDHFLLNTLATSSAATFTGHAWLTVSLKPGKENTVQLVGGKGAVNIDYIIVEPLD